MRPLERQTFGQRIVLTFVIVIAILIILSFIGWISGRWDEAPAQAITGKWDDRLIELDKQALDAAYQQQMMHVFSVWLKDGVGDPSRAKVGFRNARTGYNAAMTAIEARENK